MSLLIATVLTTSLHHRFSGTSFDCVFLLPLLLQSFSGLNLRAPLRLVGKNSALVPWMIRISTGQNCLASLLAVATITTLRAALVSSPLIHSLLEPICRVWRVAPLPV